MWRGPKFDGEFPSLGAGVVEWIETFLVHGPGDVIGEPIVLDDEFFEFIVRAYALDPHSGRRRYRRAVISRPKGRAKSELAAMIACAEALAPVRFDGWDADGEPVGKPVQSPYVRCLATEEGQSGNTYDNVSFMMQNVAERFGDEYPGIDFGRTSMSSTRVVLHRQHGEIVPSTASGASKDGGKETFAVYDEPMDLTTCIPTPGGWTTIGDLRAGDYVFGTDGLPLLVYGVAPVKYNRRCYRVTFDDYTSVVTDATHRWTVRDRVSTGKRREWSTEQMAEANHYGKMRFAVPAPGPLDGIEDSDLPLDPYVLGLWLGDGDAQCAGIAVGRADLDETLQYLTAAGCETSVYDYDDERGAVMVRFNHGQRYGKSGTSQGALRTLGVLGNKHVPELYLWASRRQRLSLLAGLMDSDGYVNDRGNCVFTNVSRSLADAVVHLARSMGWRATAGAWQSDDRWGIATGSWRVSFTPSGDVPFRLKRKAERCRLEAAPMERGIRSIEPVPSVPVRCIAVDSEDHLFLAGESMLPTHNTHLYITPELRRMHATVLRNLGKRKVAEPWGLETSTMYRPGEKSVAEGTHEYAQAVASGKIADDRSLLFDHKQAPLDTDLTSRSSLLKGLKVAYGPAAEWMDLDGIISQIRDPQSDPADSRRYWLNQPVASSDAWIAHPEWAACAELDVIADREAVTLGFDGSIKEDSTALVVCRVSDGHLQLLGCWEKPDGALGDGWQVDREAVDAAVARAFDRYDVVGFYADPAHWQDYLDRWQRDFGSGLQVKATQDRPIEWWTHRQKAVIDSLARFHDAVTGRLLTHDGDSTLTAHVLNARRRYTRYGLTIAKENPSSARKIDAAMAAALAYECRADAVAQRVTRSRARSKVMRRF